MWNILDDIENLIAPEDLKQAFKMARNYKVALDLELNPMQNLGRRIVQNKKGLLKFRSPFKNIFGRLSFIFSFLNFQTNGLS